MVKEGWSIVESIAQEAAAVSLASKEKELSRDPPLNLLTTTPRNFQKFVSVCGPTFDIVEMVRDLVTWKDRQRTAVTWLILTLLCLYPILFATLPTMILLYYAASKYYARAQDSLVVGGSSSKEAEHKADMYKKNLTRIQNFMGTACELDDLAKRVASRLDWSDQGATLAALKLLLPCTLAVGAAVLLLPVRVLALLTVSLLFLGTTPIAHAVVMIMLKETKMGRSVLVALGLHVQRDGSFRRTAPVEPSSEHSPRMPSSGGSFSSKGKPTHGRPITVETWENQRWWIGTGWGDSVLPTERPSWSDAAGKVCQPKGTFRPPAGYHWDGDWRLHTVEGGDEDAWEYSDNKWQNPTTKSTSGSYTRRRRWTRTMVPDEVS